MRDLALNPHTMLQNIDDYIGRGFAVQDPMTFRYWLFRIRKAMRMPGQYTEAGKSILKIPSETIHLSVRVFVEDENSQEAHPTNSKPREDQLVRCSSLEGYSVKMNGNECTWIYKKKTPNQKILLLPLNMEYGRNSGTKNPFHRCTAGIGRSLHFT